MTGLLFKAVLWGAAATADSECKVNGGGSQKVRACIQGHCVAKRDCNAAATNARQQSDAAAGQVGQKYGKQSSQSEPAKAIAGVERGSSALYQGAVNKCDKTFKDECEQKCKPDQAEAKDKDRIKKELDECRKDIDENKSTLNSGKSAVDSAQKGSDDTGKKSGGEDGEKKDEKKDEKKSGGEGGGAPKGGEPESKKDTASTPSPTSDTSSTSNSDAGTAGQAAARTTGDAMSSASAGGAACSTEQGALQTQCQDEMKRTCAGAASTLCTQFTNRFCGTNGATGGGEGPDDIKAGSGVSDAYCKNQTAREFCAGGGRDSCDSCRALKNMSPLPAGEQAAACGIDPASLPSLQRNGNTLSPASAGAGGGGGGGSAGGGGLSAVGLKQETKAVTENMYEKIKSAMGMDAGGGGGGGGGGSGGGGGDGGDHTVADFLAGYNVIGKSPSAARTPAADDDATTTTATDIQPRGRGPNVFFIITEVIGAHCAANKHNNCPPRK